MAQPDPSLVSPSELFIQVLKARAAADESGWRQMAPWVERMVANDHRVTVESTREHLVSGAARLVLGWSDDQIVAAAMLGIVGYPCARVLVVEYATAPRGEDLIDFLPVIEQIARDVGCTEIETHRRLAKDYREIRRGVYVKELSHGDD